MLFEVNSGKFKDGLTEFDARPIPAQVDLAPLVREFGSPQHLLTGEEQHFFGEFHDALVIGICHIELKHGEFGIVFAVHSFVAEIAANLVHSLEPPYQQALKIQLK